jgi:hypothetical protein
MMEVTILVVGRHLEILEVIVRLINGRQGWCAAGVLTDDEAIETFAQKKFNLVLIGAGVDQQSIDLLTDNFMKINVSTKIVKHYGGGSGLLFNEIQEALYPC